MSLEEKKLQPIFTDIDPNTRTVSVALDSIILRDGVQISKRRHRCAFVPGQLEELKRVTGLSDDSAEVRYLNALWTPEVIRAHEALTAQEG